MAVAAALKSLKQSLANEARPDSIAAKNKPTFIAAQPEKLIKEFPEFASVISGNIFVNGQSIDINFSTDSLADIIARIDSLDGVEAQVSPRLVINNSENGSKLDLIDNGTGFLAAVYLAGGSSRPNDFPETAGESRRSAESNAGLTKSAVDELTKKITSIFDQQPQILEVEAPLEAVKNALLGVVHGDRAPGNRAGSSTFRIDASHPLKPFSDIKVAAEKSKNTALASEGPLDRLMTTIDSILAETTEAAPGSLVDVMA